MFLASFINESGAFLQVSRQQGSDFAKQWANDFNPLHDVDAKRFVVPGDLLFSLIAQKNGIHQQMKFSFSGMVSADTDFSIEKENETTLKIESAGKACTEVEVSGPVLTDQNLIADICKEYVRFSGETFPHLLVPLMERENVMINPARPMVMYQSMVINLHEFNFIKPSLELAKQEITVEGKRGDVYIHFNVVSEGKVVGSGQKHLLLSGLRPFEAPAMEALINDYELTKSNYKNS
jgi:hypothetical protein